MCARYTVFTEEEVIDMREIIAEVERHVFAGQTLSKREIYPSHIAPVVTAGGPRPMKWGFPGIGGKRIVINARNETAAEKRMFRDAYVSRRCAIPATGFFEWGITGNEQLALFNDAAPAAISGKKDKFLFTLPDARMFYLAGLYSEYLIDGIAYPHFVILTIDSIGSVAEIHERMPIILRTNEYVSWLRGSGLSTVQPALTRRMAE